MCKADLTEIGQYNVEPVRHRTENGDDDEGVVNEAGPAENARQEIADDRERDHAGQSQFVPRRAHRAKFVEAASCPGLSAMTAISRANTAAVVYAGDTRAPNSAVNNPSDRPAT